MSPSTYPLATFLTNFVQVSVIILTLHAISKEGQTTRTRIEAEEESDKNMNPNDTLHELVQGLLKEPSSETQPDNARNDSNATRVTEELARVEPALLYFYDKYFPGEIDKAIVNGLVTGVIEKAKTIEKKKRPVNHPSEKNGHIDANQPQTSTSDHSDKVSPLLNQDQQNEFRKNVVLHKLQSILLDATTLPKLQTERENRTVSPTKMPAQDAKPFKASSNPVSNNQTTRKASENKPQPDFESGQIKTTKIQVKLPPPDCGTSRPDIPSTSEKKKEPAQDAEPCKGSSNPVSINQTTQKASENKPQPDLKSGQIKTAKIKVKLPPPKSETSRPDLPSTAEKKEEKKESDRPTCSKPIIVEERAKQESVEEIHISSAHARERASASRLKQAQIERGRVVPKPDTTVRVLAQPSVGQEPKEEEGEIKSSAASASAPTRSVKVNLPSSGESTKIAQTPVEVSKPQHASSSKAPATEQMEMKLSIAPVSRQPKAIQAEYPPRSAATSPKPAANPSGRDHKTFILVGGSVQCSGKTNQKARCRNKVRYSAAYIDGDEPRVFCYWHGVSHGSTTPKSLEPSAKEPGRCSAITGWGTLCKRNASHWKPKSEFGYCTQHAQMNSWIR